MGSPSVHPANGKDSSRNGHNNGAAGFKGGPNQFGGDQANSMLEGRPPPLNVKNVTPRPPGLQNSESVNSKKPAGKSSMPRPPREVDSNGQPIKKPRSRRPPKPIEEVTIHFKVRSMAEKLKNEEQDAGFPPSAHASDNEGEMEDKDPNAAQEEEKKEEKE